MSQTVKPPLPLLLERDRICSAGDNWLFVPDRRNPAGDLQIGYLVKNGERVELTHCSRQLAELFRILRRLEFEFSTRLC
ncbi:MULTISPECIES: hypothetical protein [Kitasatospora]|uniref:Uncharacterized protein n=1 Tax=Kitasatospora cathayae TaxID=3004092 RepID=A0ABY7QIK5_9ACTN|nr:hypothetical protein [Kitasatospora sp. HUAS 3-15]WBP92080.1 hypothetical protein O1G21_40830 [Kitasatospora sp. HUAS 3-15]